MADTVLVTGGAGYIGSHIVVELARVGHQPVVVDNFCNSSSSVIPRLERITGRAVPCIAADVRDKAALAKIFADYPVAAVVHCAGLKAVGDGEAHPLSYYDNNVGGAIALVEAMAAADVKRMVFSSSASVYGQPDRNPVTEDAPLRPHSVYGRTKRIIEQLLQDLAAADRSWRIALLRYFNPAGAHSSATIGEAPSGRPNNLVPLLADVAAEKLAEIAIYGDDWPTSDGTGVRDYIHVMDLAAGHVAALAYLASTPGAVAFNLGTGRGHSVLELIAAFERACGRTIPRRIAPRRPGDVAAYYADPSRAEAMLGVRAVRDIDAICADAWRWRLQRSDE
ncbi:MAG TPA: UDP-glucose 4-epimerase GalE [Casimicrobiaceae bacterium]|jgi:UDP-glucose 4-epimerase|nr:UDP-glucose 4-epimerase GalE [Casimicrobiaceae bacterium]